MQPLSCTKLFKMLMLADDGCFHLKALLQFGIQTGVLRAVFPLS